MKSLKNFLKLAILGIITLMAVTGCKTTTAVAGFVDGYCAKSQVARETVREAIALATAPNKVKVECHGDAPPRTNQ